jgi:DNA-binding CsgD family transcriptional regulator
MARERERAEWTGIDAAVARILERARAALHKIFIKTEEELRARGLRDALARSSRLRITRLELEDCTYVVNRLATVEKERLSRRQREVASLFIEGLPMKLIAKKLGISPRTVETHLGRLCRKYRVDSRIALARKIALMS